MNIETITNALGSKLNPIYKKRLEDELKVICNNSSGIDLLPYFLTLSDIMDFARKNGIITSPARGSSAGSLVAFILGITEVDPIKNNLPFARFLSETRIKKGSLPDIDVDFPTSKRKMILDYIFSKYGDKAAHVAIYSTLRLKNTLQDVFRALVTQPKQHEIHNLKIQSNLTEMNRLERELDKQTEDFNMMRKSLETLVPGASDYELIHGYIQDDVYTPGLLETNSLFASWAKKYPTILEMTEKILGLPRQVGRHAGGVIISPVSLPEIVPTFKDEGINTIVYDKKIAQKHGLIKYDLLGVTALDYIQSCLELLKKDGINLDIYNLPESEEMFSIFTDGRCSSLFQWSTSGGARFAKKLNPKCLNDLTLGVSLNRPGALDAKITLEDGTEESAADVFLKRKTGELPVQYLHEDLKPILEKELAVIVYQESIMEIMQNLLGYTEEEADDIRSRISDKDVRSFEKIKKDMQVLLPKGWSQSQIDDLYQQILAFSKYSFNRSHGFSYSVLSYITGWLKYHHPLQWWCAVLTHSSIDKQQEYHQDVYRYIGAPDVNNISDEFKIRNQKLIPPISSIKGVGDAVIANINQTGPFTDLKDFFEKTSRRAVNIGVVQKLTIAGALDSLIGRDFHNIENKLKFVLSHVKDKEDVPEKFQSLTPYEWYLEIKKVLPGSSASLFEAIKKTPQIKMPFVSKEVSPTGMAKYSTFRGQTPLIDGSGLQHLIEEVSGSSRSVDVCCYGYIKSLRRFAYKNNSKNAIELLVDFDFLPVKSVLWPGREEREPDCNSWLDENTAYLFFMKIRGEEGKEVQITRIKKIILEKEVKVVPVVQPVQNA